jgi:membrane-bound lytic murein transglycosylase B
MAGLLAPIPQPPERPLAPASVTDPLLPQPQRIDAFVDYTVSTYGIDPQVVRDGLAKAQFLQRTVDIISRPAEAVRPWRDYRPIFLNDARIAGGIAFYNDNRAALDRISAQTGVPAEYIVAIIGVETNYGQNTGSYRVLDALYSLAFGYPKRAPFFAGELAQLFALGKDEHLDVAALTGSYAGAMGLGQFMPSSYRLWGKDISLCTAGSAAAPWRCLQCAMPWRRISPRRRSIRSTHWQPWRGRGTVRNRGSQSKRARPC